MNSETNKENTPQPITNLVPPARAAFHGLLWPGIILLIIGVIMLLIGLNTRGYLVDKSLAEAAGWASLWQFVSIAGPFFVGAGLILGLGKRE